jgi:hypothetical protein
MRHLLILAAMSLSLNVFAAKDSSTNCGDVAMDAVVRDVVSKLAKPSDILNFDGLLGGSLQLDGSENNVSYYSVDFTQEDRFHVDYKVTVGQNCKILKVDVQGYY